MANRTKRNNPYESLGYLVGFLLVIALIASFWQVIVACIIGAFLMYLLWRFREEICQGIASIFRAFSRFITWAYNRIATSYRQRQDLKKMSKDKTDDSNNDLPMIKRR